VTFRTKALIFDFDGVLADTEPLFWRAWESILGSHKITFSWNDYCRMGRGVKDEIMLSRLPQLRADPSLYARLVGEIDTARQIVQDRIEESWPIPDATIAMVRNLRGFRIGLVTSSKRAEVEPVLRKAEILTCFHVIVTADDTIRHKPDPEPYLLAGKRLGLGRGVAFEDSEPGLISAAAAGWTAIRVDDPHNLPQIVQANLATFPG
jgi:HAD superfamily hydrolase (TIGR01509 family)